VLLVAELLQRLPVLLEELLCDALKELPLCGRQLVIRAHVGDAEASETTILFRKPSHLRRLLS
jgi:hypothetical protein